MIAIVHSIYSQSVHALALNACLLTFPSKKPCTDSIREVVGYVWICTDPHITGTIFARINPRGFHTCTP